MIATNHDRDRGSSHSRYYVPCGASRAGDEWRPESRAALPRVLYRQYQESPYARCVRKSFRRVSSLVRGARHLDLAHIEPVHVAAYIEELGRTVSKPTVKQHLATMRMLFDWLVVGQVVAVNPAASVRGPETFGHEGTNPRALGRGSTRALSKHGPHERGGIRDRAIIGVLTYTFARVSAMISLRVEDYYPQGKKWWLRLHEKNGKVNEMPCHPVLIEYLDTYMEAAGIGEERKGPLFRSAAGRSQS